MQSHALLSASGADRWMNCPPSARLEETEANESSIYAREGTFAHDLAELKLRNHLGEISKAEFKKKLQGLKNNEFYNKELESYIDVYVDFAIEKINEHKVGMVFIEKRVDYSSICKEGFGTCDLLILDRDVIEVVDLKFGKGLKVDATDNSQLKLYALGAIDNFNFIFEAKKVRMTIVQPRLDHISTEELDVEDLISWGEEEVKPKADLAYEGEGEFNPGDHCRFCRVKDRCRARCKW
jgi:predicted RecB family nuclease